MMPAWEQTSQADGGCCILRSFRDIKANVFLAVVMVEPYQARFTNAQKPSIVFVWIWPSAY